jgi:hypothetical protein
MSLTIPNKPLPNMDGMNRLVAEARSQLTLNELDKLANSEAGRVIGRGIAICHKRREQMKQAAEGGQNDEREDRRRAYLYAECLSQTTCPERYRIYDLCWRSYMQSVKQRMTSTRQSEEMVDYCRFYRLSLERCMGNLVTEAVDSLERDW